MSEDVKLTTINLTILIVVCALLPFLGMIAH